MIDPDLVRPSDVRITASEDRSLFDREMAEVTELMDSYEAARKLNEALKAEPEEFYVVNRAARRKADKRNRALQKRNPRG